ncbi:MAG: nitroreductase family protein [Coprobacillus sp.]|nr:nitroreductase family protein [Coprobacillus sp.]
MADPIFTRTSTRAYTSEDVTEEEIETILRAGMQAPNAANGQPWEIYVVKDPEVKKQLSGHPQGQAILEQAPVVFVPCYRKNTQFGAFHDIDLAACTTNMLIEIEELGLGAVWMGCSPMPDRSELVTKVLNLPDDLAPFAVVPCGHKAETKDLVPRYDETRVHKVY